MARSSLCVLAALAVLSGCATRVADTPAPDEPIQITLLGINDFHGAVLDRPAVSRDTSPRKGGAAMLSAYVQAVRAENPQGAHQMTHPIF